MENEGRMIDSKTSLANRCDVEFTGLLNLISSLLVTYPLPA